MPKFLVFTHGGGRFANQMTNMAHLMAFALENKDEIGLVNPAFTSYSQYCNGFIDKGLATFPQQLVFPKGVTRFPKQATGWLNRLKIRYLHKQYASKNDWQSILLPNAVKNTFGNTYQNFDPQDSQFSKIITQKNTLLAGWGFRCWNFVEKHIDIIKQNLQLRDDISKTAKNNLNYRSNHAEVKIGIFIRQDDYRLWDNGKYFFETSQYVSWMEQLSGFYGDKKISFLIASAEKQPTSLFSKYNYQLASATENPKLSYIQDFAELSHCDIILTPPSTFSWWAGFLGDVPLLLVTEKNQQLATQDIIVNHILHAQHHAHLSKALK